MAQKTVVDAWQTNRHTVWNIVWPQSPSGGETVVETWQANPRFRMEILEAAAPALIGQTLIFDGTRYWRYNRLAEQAKILPASPQLAPVTDAFDLINTLLQTPAQAATQETVMISSTPAQKITLNYTNGDSLEIWLDEASSLLLQVNFSARRQRVRLTSRHIEPLPNPPIELFSPGPWLP